MRLLFLALLAGGLDFGAGQTCGRQSSISDICCAASPYTTQDAYSNSALCRISGGGVTSASACPPGWEYQADHTQCIYRPSVLNVPSGTTLNTCPGGASNWYGQPCATPAAVRDICCVDAAFTMASDTRLSILCLVQGIPAGAPASVCPAGWHHQGDYSQCVKFSSTSTSVQTCSASLTPITPNSVTFGVQSFDTSGSCQGDSRIPNVHDVRINNQHTAPHTNCYPLSATSSIYGNYCDMSVDPPVYRMTLYTSSAACAGTTQWVCGGLPTCAPYISAALITAPFK